MAEKTILKFKPHKTLSPGQIVRLANRMLFNINSRLVIHNEQTAFLALELVKQHPLENSKCTVQNLGIQALFHTIGFFHADFLFSNNPYDSQVDYFSTNKSVESKYMYSCYYLEFMTPLKSASIGLEYFNQDYNPVMKKYIYQTEYKSIIYLCARICDFVATNKDKELPEDINELAPGKFDPVYVDAFYKANRGNRLINALREQTYREEILDFINSIQVSPEENSQLLKLLVYFLDFKSTSTVNHVINTTCYAVSLGERLGFSDDEMDLLFTSAMLHDIGKIATPQRILEFPGKLSPEDMGIMRHHVNHTKRILEDIVDSEILEAAYRHHEKLNGTGYPHNLTAKDLTRLQRTITVADISSALTDSRSYKNEFSQEKTIAILKEMADKNEIDSEIAQVMMDNIEEIQEERKSLSKLLSTDYSKVLEKYNNYFFNDANAMELVIEEAEPLAEEIEELEELD